MSGRHDTGHPQRRRAEPDVERTPRWRYGAAALLVAAVLGIGVFLGFGDFLGRPDAATAEALPVRMSMAGFEPGIIQAKPGQTLTIDFWTTDAAPHLQGGVHTWISPELGLEVQLPAESRKQFTFTAPATPGDYDFWCDTCCGGKASPTMHGTLHVEA